MRSANLIIRLNFGAEFLDRKIPIVYSKNNDFYFSENMYIIILLTIS